MKEKFYRTIKLIGEESFEKLQKSKILLVGVGGVGGYVAEGHMFGCKEELDRELRRKIDEMARMRGIVLSKPTIVSEEVKVPSGQYGCTVASLVFCGYRD